MQAIEDHTSGIGIGIGIGIGLALIDRARKLKQSRAIWFDNAYTFTSPQFHVPPMSL